jgi:hypothetical protein
MEIYTGRLNSNQRGTKSFKLTLLNQTLSWAPVKTEFKYYVKAELKKKLATLMF